MRWSAAAVLWPFIGLLCVQLTTAEAGGSELGPGVFDHVECTTNDALEQTGWQIHSGDDFAQLASERADALVVEAQLYRPDTEGVIYSSIAHRLVRLESYDKITTSAEEMYGDLMLLMLPDTGEIIEVRWYENGVRHIAYNRQILSCASNLVPDLNNALF